MALEKELKKLDPETKVVIIVIPSPGFRDERD